MMRREGYSKAIIVFFIILLVWALLQFIAPVALEQGSVEDLSGSTGIADNEKKIDEMPFPWNSIYGCGDSLCHQISDRSFFINGNQMPFCARCTAIWLGLTIGLGFMIFYKIELDEKFLIIIFLSLVPVGIDGVGQLLGFWESNNITRVITGGILGIVFGFAIGIIIDEIKDIISLNKTKE